MMRLCFDATKFGGGFEEAIELAAEKGLPAIEYRFEAFKASGKSAGEVKGKERKSIEQFSKLAVEKNVEIACLSLEFTHTPGDKNSFKEFVGMLSKLLEVASILNCQRLGFLLTPGEGQAWKSAFEKEYAQISPMFEAKQIKPLLRTATPAEFRGKSLKGWRAMEPQDWRDLISGCPGLSLSFSPGDCLWLNIDYLRILSGITSAIEHIEAHDIEINRDLLKDSGLFGPLWWRYRQVGKGQVDWIQLIETLKLYDYQGAFSIHFEDEFKDNDDAYLYNALDDGIQRLGFLIAR